MKHLKKYNESISREELNLSGVPENSLVYCALWGDDTIDHDGEVYEFVTKEQKSFDGEKGYITYDVIIQRKSDGKYFKGKAEDWGRGEREVNPKFVEVQRKEKITYYYE